ncbi:hypothetical protein GALL_33840 [mine drainage metagenome]|uniref:Uncharacterized protein n=1 Tax=mine drainage metagenome TaxID=410659 RepID=A0A1J5T6Y9_9ZZZZ
MYSAAIACNAQNIVCLKTMNYAIGKEKIVYPDIVMYECKNWFPFGGIDACVVYNWKAQLVFEHNVCNESSILCKTAQRNSQR